jgi:hypothetical protein
MKHMEINKGRLIIAIKEELCRRVSKEEFQTTMSALDDKRLWDSIKAAFEQIANEGMD